MDSDSAKSSMDPSRIDLLEVARRLLESTLGFNGMFSSRAQWRSVPVTWGMTKIGSLV